MTESLTLHHPHRAALLVCGGLTGLLALATGLGALLDSVATTAIAGVALVIVALVWLVVWLSGEVQRRRAAAFWASNRPLLRWVYSPEEWRAIREAAWREQEGDWRVQFGCLTLLLGLAGGLTGALIGAEDGWAEALAGAAAGALLAGLGGGLIAAAVAGGNRLAALLDYREAQPGGVALAPDEVYANGAYFRGVGRHAYVRELSLERDGEDVILTVELQALSLRPEERQQSWQILVPRSMEEALQEALPQLVLTRPEGQEA